MGYYAKDGADVTVVYPVKFNEDSPTMDGVSALFCESKYLEATKHEEYVAVRSLWARYCPESRGWSQGHHR